MTEPLRLAQGWQKEETHWLSQKKLNFPEGMAFKDKLWNPSPCKNWKPWNTFFEWHIETCEMRCSKSWAAVSFTNRKLFLRAKHQKSNTWMIKYNAHAWSANFHSVHTCYSCLKVCETENEGVVQYHCCCGGLSSSGVHCPESVCLSECVCVCACR